MRLPAGITSFPMPSPGMRPTIALDNSNWHGRCQLRYSIPIRKVLAAIVVIVALRSTDVGAKDLKLKPSPLTD